MEIKHQALTEKHRPKRLADMVGQPYATRTLELFADSPFPHAFIFSGYTGTGKSTAARALVWAIYENDGFTPDQIENMLLWNFKTIASGEMDQEAVLNTLDLIRMRGHGNGWRVVLCDEADKMSRRAADLWLSAVESIQDGDYGKSILIMTTNNPEKLEDRLRDRTEHIRFESDVKTIGIDAQALLNRLWVAENMKGNPPAVEKIPGIVESGHLSFRRVVRYVESESRKPVDLKTRRLAGLSQAKNVSLETMSFVRF